MRNPNRIDSVLREIALIWKENPDLRLGQLLLNVYRDPMLYYVEDDELVKGLKEVYRPTSNIIYGKVKQPDGTWKEDKTMIARTFGDVTKACFLCTKCDTCTATELEDCVVEKRNNVACYGGRE